MKKLVHLIGYVSVILLLWEPSLFAKDKDLPHGTRWVYQFGLKQEAATQGTTVIWQELREGTYWEYRETRGTQGELYFSSRLQFSYNRTELLSSLEIDERNQIEVTGTLSSHGWQARWRSAEREAHLNFETQPGHVSLEFLPSYLAIALPRAKQGNFILLIPSLAFYLQEHNLDQRLAQLPMRYQSLGMVEIFLESGEVVQGEKVKVELRNPWLKSLLPANRREFYLVINTKSDQPWLEFDDGVLLTRLVRVEVPAQF